MHILRLLQIVPVARALLMFCLFVAARGHAQTAAEPAAAQPMQMSIPRSMPMAQASAGANVLIGWWFAAQPGRVPASSPADRPVSVRPLVIGLHGCAGAYGAGGLQQRRLAAIWRQDAAWLGAEGIDLLVLDSFGSRGVPSICEIPLAQRPVTEQDRAADLAAALRWIAERGNPATASWDPQRIAVLGRSHGAQSVLAALHADLPEMRQLPIQLRAAIALYPGCRRQAQDPSFQPTAPLLLLVGALDDWTSPEPCVRLAQQHPNTIRLVQYDGAYHAFDSAAPVRQRTQVASTRSGTATVGGHPPSREDAHRQIFAWLHAHGLGPMQLSDEQRYRIPALAQ